jgi:hypothetical protein
MQRNIDLAQSIFTHLGLKHWVTTCEATQAELYLMKRNLVAVDSLFKECLKSSFNSEIISFCIEWLGNVSQWEPICSESRWTSMFLGYSLKCKKKLGVYKSLQFFGDLFLHQKEEGTAISLYTVALKGFTYMDVHHSRAECMLRLGDIFEGHRDPLKAMELWETARPLFERSSQAQQVENIDHRLARMNHKIQLQHRRNLARLAELNPPSGTVEEAEDNQTDVEDPESMSEHKSRVVEAVGI